MSFGAGSLVLIIGEGWWLITSDRASPALRWRTGDVLADRFELALNETISAGNYSLQAGFYDPVTGERLPLVAGLTGSLTGYALLKRCPNTNSVRPGHLA
jgi:hypothetical protein